MLIPTCPTAASSPECATRLSLADCLQRYRREARFAACDTGRYRCPYVEWGRGPTLVLIPGMASDARSFVMLLNRLAPHYRCISYDLPAGYGDGARLRSYRQVDLANDLLALLDHLRIESCDVYGASFGSTIALTALQKQPQRFARALLQGGFARRRLALAEVLLASLARFWPGRMGHLPLVKTILERNNRDLFRERDADVWDFFVEQTCHTPIAAFATRALMINRLDLRPMLPMVRHPVLLICGDRDFVVGKDCEADLQRGLPNVARAELEQCGHEPHLTHPEVLAELVQLFLTKSAG